MNYICGIRAIDNGTRGMKDGDSTLIAGVSGGHKTNMLLNMANGFQMTGATVFFLSLETDTLSLQVRMMCRVMDIDVEQLINQPLTQEIQKKIKEYDNYSGSRIAITSASYRMPLAQLLNFIEVRSILRPFNILMIDSLALIESGSEENTSNTIYNTIRQLRILGSEKGFALVASIPLPKNVSEKFKKKVTQSPAIPDSVIEESDLPAGSTFLGIADNIFILRPMIDNKLEVSAVKLRYSTGVPPTTMKIFPSKYKLVDVSADALDFTESK